MSDSKGIKQAATKVVDLSECSIATADRPELEVSMAKYFIAQALSKEITANTAQSRAATHMLKLLYDVEKPIELNQGFRVVESEPGREEPRERELDNVINIKEGQAVNNEINEDRRDHEREKGIAA